MRDDTPPRAGRGRVGLLAALLAVACAGPTAGVAGPAARDRPADNEKEAAVKIRLIVAGEALTATLADNPAARDFLALLPLDLTLKDYARTEKVGDLPRTLKTDGAPGGMDPAVGDLAYYAPWGNLAIFYRDFRYADGLVPLARIDGGLEALTRHAGPLPARIERVDAGP